MDIGEGMCYGECCELCKTDESQTCAPETNNTLYVNKNKTIVYGIMLFSITGERQRIPGNKMRIAGGVGG